MSDDKKIRYYDIYEEDYFNERMKESDKNMRRRFKRDRMKAEGLIFPIRVILFPIMLIVRLFRWTYYYD